MLTSELFALAPLQQEPPGSLGILEVKEIAIKTAAQSCFFLRMIILDASKRPENYLFGNGTLVFDSILTAFWPK